VHQPGHSLLIRCGSTGELAFYCCWSPAPVTLAVLVRVAGARWAVEEGSQAAKGQVGLDHYQVRTWIAWHRHITLAMLALTACAAAAAPPAPAGPWHHAPRAAHRADRRRDPPPVQRPGHHPSAARLTTPDRAISGIQH
jgi:hypothetical protein